MNEQELYELQRDILQYDLSKNPYLQPNNILSLDKELKTESKKIIPAINEILKLVNTFTLGIQNFMEEVDGKFIDIDNSISELENKIKNTVSAEDMVKIEEQYNSCNKEITDAKNEIEEIKESSDIGEK